MIEVDTRLHVDGRKEGANKIRLRLRAILTNKMKACTKNYKLKMVGKLFPLLTG